MFRSSLTYYYACAPFDCRMTAEFLAGIDKRLRSVRDPGRDFGGLGVLLVGDVLQIPACRGTALVKAAVKPCKDPATALGGNLFRAFRVHFLTQQKRAEGDPALQAHLLAMRDVEAVQPVSAALLGALKPLTVEDIVANPSWLDPTVTRVLVTTNHARMTINRIRAVQFATMNNRVVLAWRRPLTMAVRDELDRAGGGPAPKAGKAKHKSLSERHLSAVGEALERGLSDMFLECVSFFVAGAPCMLVENVDPRVGLANGSVGRFHSLVLDEESQAYLDTVLSKGPQAGQVIMLPSPPLHVNVALPVGVGQMGRLSAANQEKLQPYNVSTTPGELVVPIPPVSELNSKKVDTDLEDLKGRLYVRTPVVDLLFSCTLWKCQGLTLDQVRALLCFALLCRHCVSLCSPHTHRQ